MSGLDEFQFDDATSLGFMRLEKIREAQEIIRRVEVDRPSLQGASKPYLFFILNILTVQLNANPSHLPPPLFAYLRPSTSQILNHSYIASAYFSLP
jgi:hypothetical protein